MTKTTVKISGMSCMHCVGAVKKALGAVPGIQDLNVQVGSAEFQSEAPVDAATIKTAIDNAGFDVVSIA